MKERGKAIELIQKSGVLNPKMTLEDIMTVSGKLDSLEMDPLAAWTFISPNFVYTGDDEVAIDKR
jgi:hypothetical protein